MAATFTPFFADGSLNLGQIPGIVDYLERGGCTGIYVLGSTGEGLSLDFEERKTVAEAYVKAARSRLKVVVQIGSNSLVEARNLARHAGEIGADAISCVPPSYFKPETEEALVDSMIMVASGSPAPFYYYHVPGASNVHLDMVRFLELAKDRIPTLVGMKYSSPVLHDLLACLRMDERRFDLLFGCDEMLLGALAMGVRGAVGSTYNFAAPLYNRMIAAFDAGDLESARAHQATSVEMVRWIVQTAGRSGFKMVMRIIGVDCGPHRLPLRDPSDQQIARLREGLERIGCLNPG